MKMRALFNLIADAKEISDLFHRVETPEQMVSTLERLKKQGAGEFLEAVKVLRLSVEEVLEDTLEVGGTVGFDPENENENENLGEEDEDLLEDLNAETDEDENSKEKPPTQEVNS